jgi:peroxiredoxin
MRKTLFFNMSLLLFGLVVLSAGPSWAHQSEAFERMGVVSPRTEKLAPNFSLETPDGRTLGLDNFKGKVVLLNFWVTWCAPCKAELLSMQRLYEAFRPEGVEVVAISIDRNKKERIKEYIKDYNLTFPVLLDPGQEVRKGYYIMGLPTSYLIGADGKLKGFISGAREWDSVASKKLFSKLIH